VTALSTTFLLGAGYFIAAIPAGVALGLSPWLAALSAGAGYFAITLVVLLAGSPARNWLLHRCKISTQPDPKKWFWRIWRRAGLPGLGLIAPITCGPWIAALIALALRESPLRVLFWITLGVVPYLVGFAWTARIIAN
jgi:hypothetical protein